MDLLAVLQQVRDDDNIDTAEKDRLKCRQAELNKLVSKLDNKTRGCGLPPTFAEDLIAELDTRDAYIRNDNHGKVMRVKIALFQADTLIAKRAIGKKSDVIVASDTDYFVSVGPQCLLISKSFKFKQGLGRQQGKVALMEIQQLTIGCSTPVA